MPNKHQPWRPRIIPEPNSGCWLWEGGVTNGGFGTTTVNGRAVRVHRLAWEDANGPIPIGLNVFQTCGMPACCNPSHMYLAKRPAGIPWRDRLARQANGCWIFTGALSNDGYGQIGRDGTTIRVHRLAWEEANGPIPDGMRICHTCDVPACCNPDHLFLGTQQDNVADMVHKGRFKGGSSLNALKTHCPQGHVYTPENTMTYRGMRSCRQCMNQRSARYHRQKRRPE